MWGVSVFLSEIGPGLAPGANSDENGRLVRFYPGTGSDLA